MPKKDGTPTKREMAEADRRVRLAESNRRIIVAADDETLADMIAGRGFLLGPENMTIAVAEHDRRRAEEVR